MCKYLVIVFVCLLKFSYASECKPIGNCACEYYDGTGIDLKQVMDIGEQPLRTNVSDGDAYYFSPCKESTITTYDDSSTITKNECRKGYTLCKFDAVKQELIRLGELNETRFTSSDGLYLSYIKPNQSETYVKLVCSRDKKSYFFFESSTNVTTHLLLFSPYACPVVVEDFSKPSTGTVLLIMLFVGMLSYFVIGATVNAFYIGARGMEVIPHLDFWRNLPGLVRDGAQFLQNGCRVPHRAPDPDSYDAI
uniref:Mannose-6-phosphate receptor domain-containing protein n=1 Tax=Anopheles farauti TaxID=69004 RepID=A0A182Q7A0_9DIPT